MCKSDGRLFQILGPWYLILFSPYVVWLTLGTERFWDPLNPIRPVLFSRLPGPRGGSETCMPKIKVNIYRLKWNFAWVIISIKAFLMHNLRLIAFLVLEIWHHKISFRRREWVIKFGYLSPENGFNVQKMGFYVQNCSSRPKIDPPCQFQQFSSRGKIFHFQNFWDISMRKEQQQPPWFTNFC